MTADGLRIGICGLGTVGSGVVNIFNSHGGLIRQRCGADFRLTHIGARRDNPDCDLASYRVSRDIFEVVRDPDVDIVVELIGGTTVARQLVMEALEQGKHVVTANKALLAEHGAQRAVPGQLERAAEVPDQGSQRLWQGGVSICPMARPHLRPMRFARKTGSP